MIRDKGIRRQIAWGFEREQEPEPPERVLADFEALSDDDRLWAYEMIRGWMEQTGPCVKRQPLENS